MLYRSGLRPLERTLTGARAAQLLGRATPRDVFIAHELYHHIEAIRPEAPIARRYRPTLFRIGSWHWRTGIGALSDSLSVREHIARLFAWYRAEGGTGLGLALVKHILNRHRGKLSIESEAGKGATFTVRLPLIHSPVRVQR